MLSIKSRENANNGLARVNYTCALSRTEVEVFGSISDWGPAACSEPAGIVAGIIRLAYAGSQTQFVVTNLLMDLASNAYGLQECPRGGKYRVVRR